MNSTILALLAGAWWKQGWIRGGKTQHTLTRVDSNIISASYSPASLVLPKLSYPKYIREMHHLKVTVCKYLHSHNHHAMTHKGQYDMNKVMLWKALLHILFCSSILKALKKFMCYTVLYLASSYIKWTRNIS